ncbi:MAG TPA: protease modulator HflC [Rhodanobacteraceae bacterium]
MKMLGAAILVLLVLAAANSILVVREGHAALLLQLGSIEGAALDPGLHFKWPFVQRAEMYDTRAIVTESEPDDYQTSDGNAVQVGFYVRWRIIDPQAYYRATSGEELQATQQMTPLVHDALRSQVQAHTLAELIGSDNGAIGTRLRTLVDPETRQRLGVQILDVGIERVDFPDQAADAVYKRMQANAKAEAATLRGQGEDKAAAIRADGENEAQSLLAQAEKDAATTRGEGDAQAAKIYADAAAPDQDFFRFWSGLQAYRDTFGDGHAVIVLDQNSPLLKDIGQPSTNPAQK